MTPGIATSASSKLKVLHWMNLVVNINYILVKNLKKVKVVIT